MEITAEIRALIDKAAVGMELAGDEYIDPADGLIHQAEVRRPEADRCAMLREIRLLYAALHLPVPAGG